MSLVYIETYGCQMNVADSEVVISLLNEAGYTITQQIIDADIILINTCSVRENAEERIRGRLAVFNTYKKKKPQLIIGLIGCMAELLKEKLFDEEKMIDLLVGPDSYRKIPDLITETLAGKKTIDVMLRPNETYGDITPVRYSSNGVSAFISIMRGCNNMCAYCVVPYTRGNERSRDVNSILNEIQQLANNGYKEVTLIGQNVDSYSFLDGNVRINFAMLLERVAKINPMLRVRFATSHPRDITDEVLLVMKNHDTICKAIHLPMQSGSTRILKLMNRGYTREWYMKKIETIKSILPDCSISTDIITGFCSETEQDHRDTLEMMNWVEFDFTYMFKYSDRPNTYAHLHLQDDVPEQTKIKRLNEIIELQKKLSLKSKLKDINKTYKVLIDGISKKSKNELCGRNSQNKVIVFPASNYSIGQYVNVLVEQCTTATLKGRIVE